MNPPTELDLVSAIYTSTATTIFTEEQLRELLEVSRDRNGASAVTGMLLYRAGRFIQVLEGPSATVERLLERIRADHRHTGMRVLRNAPTDSRSFAEWTMGYEPITVPRAHAVEGLRDAFDDLEQPSSALALRALRDLTIWFRVRSGVSPLPRPAELFLDRTD